MKTARPTRFAPTALFLCLIGLPLSACDCGGEGLIDTSALLELSSDAIDFGRVPVGTERVKSVTLKNAGSSVLRITRAELIGSPDFVTAAQVPDQIAAGSEFVWTIVYAPGEVGEDLGELEIEASDDLAIRKVSLRGEGVEGGIGVMGEPAECDGGELSVSFGDVTPGETGRRDIVFEAQGTAPVTILSAAIEPGTSSEFAIEPASQVVLQPGETHTLEATYTPVDGGTDAGAFIITTDAAANPSIRIGACGRSVAPAVCITPTPVDFGPTAVNNTSQRMVTIESCGLVALQIDNIVLASDAQHPTDPAYAIEQSPSTPVTLDVGMTLDVDLSFTPTDFGAKQGWLQVDSNAEGLPSASVPLLGQGAQPCALEILPDRILFGTTPVGMTTTRSAIAVNTGASDCTLTRVEVTTGSPPFTVTPPAMPTIVPAGGSVSLDVNYTPTGTTPDMGVLEVEGGAVFTVDLIGNPDVNESCVIDIRPPVLNFGAVPPGQVRSAAVELYNLSDSPCVLTGVSLAASSDPGFTENAPSLGLILPGRSKQIAATYSPVQFGSARGQLDISFRNGPTPNVSVPMFASSADTGICVTPRHLPFGDVLGLTALDFQIAACGGRSVTVTALDFTVADVEFRLRTPPTLPFTLAPGSDQFITVEYEPMDQMGDTGELTVRSNDPVEPAIAVLLTGGPEIVPSTAGRYLYYWSIRGISSEIMRMPLQGNLVPEPYWGPSVGKSCSGCHSVAPDGKYVAIVEQGAFRMVDTTNNVALQLPGGITANQPSYVSWNPDVNTNPPYQYAYDFNGDIYIASLFGGVVGTLAGADTSNFLESMPTWGPNGKIVFVRGTQGGTTQGGAFGFQGPTDIMEVAETGGVANVLTGAAGGTSSNYYPAFSPNGRWIAFTQSASAMSTIAASDAVIKLVAADNSGTVFNLQMANSAVGDGATSYPTWSKDGAFLSFSSSRAGGMGDWDIYIAPIDPMSGADGPAMQLGNGINTPAFEHSAQWSP